MMMILPIMLIGAVSAASSDLMEGWEKTSGRYQRIRKGMAQIQQTDQPVFTAICYKMQEEANVNGIWKPESLVWDTKEGRFARVKDHMHKRDSRVKIAYEGSDIRSVLKSELILLRACRPLYFHTHKQFFDTMTTKRFLKSHIQFLLDEETQNPQAAWITYTRAAQNGATETNREMMRFVKITINVAGQEQKNECDAYKNYLKKAFASRRQVPEKQKVQTETKTEASIKANMGNIQKVEDKSAPKKDGHLHNFVEEMRQNARKVETQSGPVGFQKKLDRAKQQGLAHLTELLNTTGACKTWVDAKYNTRIKKMQLQTNPEYLFKALQKYADILSKAK